MTIDEAAEEVPEAAQPKDEAINQQRYKALMITGIVLPLMLYPYLGHLFLNYDMTATWRIICSEVFKWLTLGILYLYATRFELNDFLLWREEKYNAVFYLKFIILIYLMVRGAVIISNIPHVLGYHDNYQIMRKTDTVINQYPLLLACVCLTAGISEELIFRGYILSRLSLFFKNQHWPVVISALIFASVHLGYKNLGELIFVFIFGLIFGYHYQRYRNLLVLMIVHFITDFIAIGLYHPHK
jgi:membrane protease YdiL (CAAX protease family)